MKRSMVFEGAAVTLLLLLSFLVIAMLLGGNPETQTGATGQTSYLYAGNDGTLYAFAENYIEAIDGNGNRLWDFSVPETLKVGYGWYYYPDFTYDPLDELSSTAGTNNITARFGGPIAFSDNGTLYVYLVPNATRSVSNASSPADGLLHGDVYAISREGKVLWSLPVESLAAVSRSAILPKPNDTAIPFIYPANGTAVQVIDTIYSDAVIYARGDKVYVFHDYNETVIDRNGNVLWNLANVSDPVSVDEDGYVYGVPAREPREQYSQPFIPYTQYSPDNPPDVIMGDYRVPSAIIDAYYPNGTLYWEAYPGELLFRQYMGRNPMPLYDNGTIYAAFADGIMALDRNGTGKWAKKFNADDFSFRYTDCYSHIRTIPGDFRIYEKMPFDSKGNVYVEYISRSRMPYSNFTWYADKNLYLIALDPDGNEISRTQFFDYVYASVNDGIGYATGDTLNPPVKYPYYPDTAENLTSLGTEEITAFKVGENKELWNYTFPVDDPVVGVLYENNSGEVIGYDNNDDYGRFGHFIESRVEVPEVVAGNGRVYAYFRSKNWESPIIYGQSKYAYVSGVYVFDQSGVLLWNKTISPGARSMSVAGNGTVFYRTPDGRIGVTNSGIAAGFTLTTLLYLFLRFLLVGAVARAKARLNTNDNRNRVLDFIARNPGSTLYEISRGTDMNIGTIRYHLFILGMNHKIVSSRMDGKYIRHFTNSNTYGKEEQFALSLARRGTVGKILALLLQKPGISNVQISRELGVTESEVSRYMGELVEKGIVVKGTCGKERAYSIEASQRQLISDSLRRLDNL